MKIAILGASGIGKFHARTFDKLNVEVNSILCSSKVTGKSTSQDLQDSLGLKVNYYDDLDMLLNKSMPDAITICTPNELHYEQILKVLPNIRVKAIINNKFIIVMVLLVLSIFE